MKSLSLASILCVQKHLEIDLTNITDGIRL